MKTTIKTTVNHDLFQKRVTLDLHRRPKKAHVFSSNESKVASTHATCSDNDKLSVPYPTTAKYSETNKQRILPPGNKKSRKGRNGMRAN